MRKLALLAMAALGVSACAHTPPPRITSDHSEIPGVYPLAAERGLSEITLFVTHGMGDTEQSFGDDVVEMVRGGAPRSGDSAARMLPVCLDKPYRVRGESLPEPGLGISCAAAAEGDQPFARFGIISVTEVEGRYQGRPIPVRVYSYWWQGDASLIQAPYMQDLPVPGERRAPLNARIKSRIINDGFSDAVLYAGSFGEVMRDGMRNAVCLMALDRQGLTPEPTRSACAQLGGAGDATALAQTHVALLTSSLGGRILFDALGEAQRDPAPDAVRRLAATLTTASPVIYMSANQLPLLGLSQLDVARWTPQPAPGSSANFLSRFLSAATTRADGPRAPNRIVAFFDPNDLLGYRAGAHLPSPLAANIIEVEQHYARPGRLLADPVKAHDQSFSNALSRRFIMCGATRTAKGLSVREPCAGSDGSKSD